MAGGWKVALLAHLPETEVRVLPVQGISGTSQKSPFSLKFLSLPARKRLLLALKGSALLTLRLASGQT